MYNYETPRRKRAKYDLFLKECSGIILLFLKTIDSCSEAEATVMSGYMSAERMQNE